MTMRSALAAAFVVGLSFSAMAQQHEDIASLNQRLFAAVRANDIATVRLVLTNGADPMAVDGSGQTPAGIAIDRGYFDIAHHILGVRNQRQAFMKRDADNERIATRPTASSVAAMASAPPVDRKPDVGWRDNAVPGQAAEIPTPRLSSPQAPVVVTPTSISNGPLASRGSSAGTAKKKPASAHPSSPVTVAKAGSGPAAGPRTNTLVNLPVLPAGAPNPFDPKSVEPEAPPALSSTAAPSPIAAQASVETDQPRETSSSNPFTRLFNGITGVFGGGS